MAEDAVITEENNIISFKTSQNLSQTSSENNPVTGGSDKKGTSNKK
jgi:hypothetical protein